MKNNNNLYRQRLVDRLTRQLRRSHDARSLELSEHRQQRISSARLYSRKRKHTLEVEE